MAASEGNSPIRCPRCGALNNVETSRRSLAVCGRVLASGEKCGEPLIPQAEDGEASEAGPHGIPISKLQRQVAVWRATAYANRWWETLACLMLALCAGVILFVSLGFLLLRHLEVIPATFGWTPVVLSFGGIWLSCNLVQSARQRQCAVEAARAPCRHGTVGANRDSTKCPQCVSERLAAERVALAAERDAMRAREDDRRNREAQRQRAYRDYLARIRLPEYLKGMDPREFETLVGDLFKRIGYDVELTAHSGDHGVDGWLRKGGALKVLQCKRVKGSVGEPVLRDLLGTMHANKAVGGVLVTTGTVSAPARRWAVGRPIRIIELGELRRLIDEHFKEDEVIPADYSAEGDAALLCEKCGKTMREVRGPRGKFMGCSGYPTCHYTREIAKPR